MSPQNVAVQIRTRPGNREPGLVWQMLKVVAKRQLQIARQTGLAGDLAELR